MSKETTIQLRESDLKAQALIGMASVVTGIVGNYIAKRINPDAGTIGFMIGGAVAPIALILLFKKKK